MEIVSKLATYRLSDDKSRDVFVNFIKEFEVSGGLLPDGGRTMDVGEYFDTWLAAGTSAPGYPAVLGHFRVVESRSPSISSWWIINESKID